jgi:hypothetical protein
MKIYKVLLKKFYHNECREDESRRVYEWLSDPAHDEEVAAILSREWDETESERPFVRVDLDALLTNIKSKTGCCGTPLHEKSKALHSDPPQEL